MEKTEKVSGAVFIGDPRLQYASRYLKHAGITLETAKNFQEAQQLLSRRSAQFDFVLLPGTTPRTGQIRLLDGAVINADAFLRALDSQVMVFTGHETPYIRQLSARVVDCFADEEVMQANARLTAEGILYMLLGQTPGSLYQYDYDIIGAGHTGRATQGMLQALHLPVRMVTKEGGEGAVSTAEWLLQTPADVVICTAPTRIVTYQTAQNWQKPVVLLDITTAQSCVEAAVAQLPKVQLLAAPPLPGLVAPKAAGSLIANFVLKAYKNLIEGSREEK
ncbi:hypothetical protein U6B65_11480 [Oscillospiraceae bacterium MB08-C2-2]|nr:hypothetical protein U6B65_11480 [Oscillospiraceae bacterium MB08-C2-2]